MKKASIDSLWEHYDSVLCTLKYNLFDIIVVHIHRFGSHLFSTAVLTKNLTAE